MVITTDYTNKKTKETKQVDVDLSKLKFFALKKQSLIQMVEMLEYEQIGRVITSLVNTIDGCSYDETNLNKSERGMLHRIVSEIAEIGASSKEQKKGLVQNKPKETESKAVETTPASAPDNSMCDRYVTIMRNAIEKARTADDTELQSIMDEFNAASAEACRYATEKQREKLIPALQVQMSKASERKHDKLPDWMLDNLIKPTPGNAENDAVMYIQGCDQLLADESANPNYAEKVERHKELMVLELLDQFGPAIVADKEREGKNICIDNVEEWLCRQWDKNCSFKIGCDCDDI